jgi:hypothetical protein
VSEGARARRPRGGAHSSAGRAPGAAPSPAAKAAPAWAGAPAALPLGLGGIQRRVTIGEPGDAYEQEAESIASRVAAGQQIAPASISPIGALPTASTAQRAEPPEEKQPIPDAVQKAEAPDPEKELPAPPPVQKAAKPPEEQKPDDVPALQKAEDDESLAEKLDDVPVQTAAKEPEEVTPDEVPALQKAEDEESLAEKLDDVPVQTAAKAPEEMPEDVPELQKAEADEPLAEKLDDVPVQTAAKAPEEVPEDVPELQKADDDERVQPDAAPSAPAPAPAATPSMEATAANAIGSRGAGEPLHAGTRDALESRMGVDLGGVRVHEGAAARRDAEALNARAFTHGNDIWLGPGEAQSDVGLMAHEATHVVQQAGGVHRMLVQREWDPPGETGAAVDLEAKKVRVPRLEIPEIKAGTVPEEGLEINRIGARTDQISDWKRDVKPTVESALTTKLTNVPGIRRGDTGEAAEDRTDDPNKVYILRIGGSGNNMVIGNRAQLADELTIPRWDRDGQPRSMDVDHKQEIQLGGAPDQTSNMWLLDASANRSSGVRIARRISQAIRQATQAQRGEGKRWPEPPSFASLIDEGFTIRFERIDANQPVAGDGNARWEKSDVTSLEPWDKLHPVPVSEIANNPDLIGGSTRLIVYPASGGRPKPVSDWNVAEGTKPVGDTWLKGLKGATVTYQPGGGTVDGTLFGGRYIEPKPVSFPISDVGGVPFTGVIDRGALLPSMRFAEFKLMSPIEFDDAGYDETRGFYAHGVLRPSLPVFRDVEIDIWVDADGITLSKTFSKNDFEIPGPVQITEASVTLGAGTSGLSAEGALAFEIERLGRGNVGARVGTGGGFELAGAFNFDSDLFDPARINIGYSEGRWTGSGTLGIPAGKVQGIRGADLTVAYDDGTITATGNVRPQIPGVEQASLNVRYSEEEGLLIGGQLQLANAPGIRSGTLDVTVTKTDRWKVAATGTAVPSIPGIATNLTIAYDDGAFDITGTAAYERGMLSGSIALGVTNRPVGEDGRPAGPPAPGAEQLTVYGGGRATLRIAPWLQATAGIRLLPNGEIEVAGEIGLPAALDIFPEKRLDRNIFTVGMDIPIVGVAVAGQRIGIFANISGGLDLSAGIGPGQLQDVRLGITYNPAREEETHVQGGAKLHIPAQAGLRMFVRGALGAGIPVVSAQAGLEIGGQLGLAGAVEASVEVDWTPSRGLQLEALGEIYVQPKFVFDITGFVLVEADLWLTTIDLYSKRWRLAAMEYGSDLRFGLKFPIRYQEGQPFDISLSDVQFELPTLDAGSMLRGLISRIA